MRTFDNLYDRQVKFFCELPVTSVVGGNRHDRPGAVTDQDKVGNPDRERLAVCRIDGVRAGKNTGFFFLQSGSFELCFQLCLLDILFNLYELLCSCQLFGHRMFRRNHQIGCAEKCVGPCCINPDRCFVTGELEVDFNPFGSTDPVTLHLLDVFRPVNLIKVFEQPFSISGDFQNPLSQRFSDDGKPVGYFLIHLFIGKHGFEFFAPVYIDLTCVGKSAVEHLKENPLRPGEV